MTFIRLSVYHIIVVVIYFFVYVWFLFFTPDPFSYFQFKTSDLKGLLPVIAGMVASLLLANKFLHYRRLKFNKRHFHQFLAIVFYALVLFAIPEEIIFRGIIQNFFQLNTSGPYLAIVLSSLVYGLAHLLNGARSFGPKGWNFKLAILTFIAGIPLGYIYFLTGSLVIPIVLHALLIVVTEMFIND